MIKKKSLFLYSLQLQLIFVFLLDDGHSHQLKIEFFIFPKSIHSSLNAFESSLDPYLRFQYLIFLLPT